MGKIIVAYNNKIDFIIKVRILHLNIVLKVMGKIGVLNLKITIEEIKLQVFNNGNQNNT